MHFTYSIENHIQKKWIGLEIWDSYHKNKTLYWNSLSSIVSHIFICYTV